MRLNDAEPTPMYSGSSDETGSGKEDDNSMGLHGGDDDSLLLLDTANNDQRQIMDSTSPRMT